MLTPTDLQKISTIVKTTIEPVKTDVSTLKTDVSTLKTDVSTLKTDVSTLKTDVSDLKKGQRKLARGQKLTLNYLERDLISHRDEIRKINRHLGLPISI